MEGRVAYLEVLQLPSMGQPANTFRGGQKPYDVRQWYSAPDQVKAALPAFDEFLSHSTLLDSLWHFDLLLRNSVVTENKPINQLLTRPLPHDGNEVRFRFSEQFTVIQFAPAARNVILPLESWSSSAFARHRDLKASQRSTERTGSVGSSFRMSDATRAFLDELAQAEGTLDLALHRVILAARSPFQGFQSGDW